MSRKTTLIAVSCLLVSAGLGAALGLSNQTSAQEASDARDAAFARAQTEARDSAYEKAAQAGKRKGSTAGRKAGTREGEAAGTRRGEKAAAAEQQAQAEVEAAAVAAEVPQEVYCPLAADNSATPADCAALSERESYCGGFDPAQVQPDGSYLPKPGC